MAMVPMLIDGKRVLVEESDEDFLERALKRNNLTVERDDWETVGVTQRFYDCHEFIKDASFYYNQNPKNLVQTAVKLWLCVVYKLKSELLEIGIHVVSHKAMKVMVQKIAAFSPNQRYLLETAWSQGELLHRFSYGSTEFDLEMFPVALNNIEKFVEFFPALDENFRLGIIGGERVGFTIVEENGEAKLGQTSYEYQYVLY